MTYTIELLAVADKNVDSGNINPNFFKKEYWEPDENNIAVFNLADGSVKFSRSYVNDFGYYKNDGFETMFKCVGGFELTFRANEDATEGYVFGIQAPSNISKGGHYSFYLKKANGNSILAYTSTMPSYFTYGEWIKLGVKFNDENNKTEMIITINDIKLDFFATDDRYNPDHAADFENIKFENGNLIDSSPYSKSNSFIKVRPYYNGGFESSPNKDNQIYFASIDNVNKINKDNYVTKIAVIGDSITQGVGSENATVNSYVAYLQKMLGSHYDVYNCGASANSVMTNTYQPYTIQVIYYSSMLFDPDYVIFALGTNDGQSSYWDRLHYFGPSTDSSSDEWRIVDVKKDESGKYIEETTYAADKSVATKITAKNDTVTYYFKTNDGTEHTYNLVNAEQMYIDQANSFINTYSSNGYNSDAHAKIIISSVMKTWGECANTWNRQKEAFEAQKKLASKNDSIIGFIDNYSITEKYDESSTENHYTKFSDDGLHPNSNGHKLLAENIYNHINKNLDLKTDDIVMTYGPKKIESEPESSQAQSNEIIHFSASNTNLTTDDDNKSNLPIFIIFVVILVVVICAILLLIYHKRKKS
ncbi:MAG: hypothetical protein IJE65_01240 [Clostridia bacterium]|nr:hypothetical protein [Clostridia bacterium]